jgi:universal stress protein A
VPDEEEETGHHRGNGKDDYVFHKLFWFSAPVCGRWCGAARHVLSLTKRKLLGSRRRITRRKKRTRFSKHGAAGGRDCAQTADMKTEALLKRGATAGMNLHRILVPVDFSPLSKKAVHYATRLAQQFGGEVDLLHVVEPEVPPTFDGFMVAPPILSNGSSARSATQLKHWANSVRNAGVTPVNSTVRCGLASIEIVDAAKELDVDLIVIATHGYTGWKHFAIGSTAERVVRAAPCPVLVVRDKEHEFA